MTDTNLVSESLAYTYTQAAELLHISPRLVWSLVASGQLKAIRIGRCVRLPRAEILRFIEEHQNQPRRA